MFQHVISCAFIACGLCGLWVFRYLEDSLFIFPSLQGRHNRVYRPSSQKKYCPTSIFSGVAYKFTLFLSLPFSEGPYRTLFGSHCPNLVCQVASALCSSDCKKVDTEASFKLLFSYFQFSDCFEIQSYLTCFCTTDFCAGYVQLRLAAFSLLFPRPLVIHGTQLRKASSRRATYRNVSASAVKMSWGAPNQSTLLLRSSISVDISSTVQSRQ